MWLSMWTRAHVCVCACDAWLAVGHQNIESLLDGYVNLVRFGAVSNAVLAPRSQSRDLLTVLHSVAETHFANLESSAAAATPLRLVLGTVCNALPTVRNTVGSQCLSRRGDGHRHQIIRRCVLTVRGRWLVQRRRVQRRLVSNTVLPCGRQAGCEDGKLPAPVLYQRRHGRSCGGAWLCGGGTSCDAIPSLWLGVSHLCRATVQCAEGLGPAGNFLAAKYGPIMVASLDDAIELSQNCSYGLGVMFESIGMESAPLIDTAIPALIALLRIPHYPHPPAQDNASAALARFVRWSIARHVRCGEPVA